MIKPMRGESYLQRVRSRRARPAEPRYRVPELDGIPTPRANAIYASACTRSWRRAPTWAAAALVAALFALAAFAWFGILVSGVFRSPAVIILVQLGVTASAVVLGRLFDAIRVRTIRRIARAELGTNCADCDYDLRATPDLRPPAIARCPECGRPIPRNVHRPVLRPPVPFTTATPPAPVSPDDAAPVEASGDAAR
jgi:hypothetical protein